MFRSLRSSQRQSASRKPTAHRSLRLEVLEYRYALSGIAATPFDGPVDLAEVAPAPYDQELRESDSVEAPVASTTVPEIVDFEVDVEPTGVMSVRGTVVDDDPAGMPVSISWPFDSDQVMTDIDGNFYFTVELEPETDGLVSAVTWNDVGESETVEQYVEYYPD